MSLPSPVVSPSQMQARELAELAAILAACGLAALDGSSRISQTAMDDYAAAAQQRHLRWTGWMRRMRGGAGANKNARAWLEEIFVSEALTRVWGAIVYADALTVRQETTALFRVSRATQQHVSVRHRAMRLLANSPAGLSYQDAAQSDRLRRSIARWIDLLVAHVQHGVTAGGLLKPALPTLDVCQFAMEPPRAREFAEDLQQQHAVGLGRSSLAMAIVSLRASLSRQLRGSSPNGQLNHAMASSIVACFAPDVFDATGPYRALWATRLTHRAADAERLIGQLLAE